MFLSCEVYDHFYPRSFFKSLRIRAIAIFYSYILYWKNGETSSSTEIIGFVEIGKPECFVSVGAF